MPVYAFALWRRGGERAVLEQEPCASDEAALQRASRLLAAEDTTLVVVSRRDGPAVEYLGAWSWTEVRSA